ncbi:hypothetical protein [Sphingopyxis sp. R3-92]|uniref:hypothetical protein n=1 Tax=Sphingopyxis sp. R3-92 TaxID=3158553 RepID=UPI003EE48329
MRRVILFFLTLLLASGTVAGSLVHATEDRAEASLFVAAFEAGCVSAPAIESDEGGKKKSSPGEKQPVPAAAHGCHGHHAGVPAETLSAATETPVSEAHTRILTAALPLLAYIGTFRPPIA